MITDAGKEIISKYMLGQAPAYATHISLGCGAKPMTSGITGYTVSNKELSASVATLTTTVDHDFYPGDEVEITSVGTPFNGVYTVSTRPSSDTFTYVLNSASVASASANGQATHKYSTKQVMDFEMVRIPISSRGFVNDNGVSKLALSAEMPTEYRYEVSEVALWSAGANSAVTTSDSRILFTFDSTENWQLHKTASAGSTGPIPFYGGALDGGDNTFNINLPNIDNNLIFSTNADNASLQASIRKNRQESSRFLNYTIFMRGDTSAIDSSFVVNSVTASADSHIHLDGRNFNLSKNSPNDQIKVALSIVPQQASNTQPPYQTRIVIEFLQSEIDTTIGKATLKHEIPYTDLSSDNRYVVITKSLKDIETTPDFSWSDVRLTRIYVSVYKDNGDTDPSDEYYVALDAIRFDNTNTPNPLYCMSGYAVVDSVLARPITKIANTSNYIEFRLTLGVT